MCTNPVGSLTCRYSSSEGMSSRGGASCRVSHISAPSPRYSPPVTTWRVSRPPVTRSQLISPSASPCGTGQLCICGRVTCWQRSRMLSRGLRGVTSLTRSLHVGLLGGQAPPRIRHAPNVRANAWEDVSDLAASFGLRLDEWQEEVLRAAMGERADGRWAARQVGVSTPRQNGKTMLIVARALAGLLLFDEQIIIVSAHRQDTAREVFFRLVQIIEDNPALENRVDFIARSELREIIRIKTGQKVRSKARSSGSGRGFSCDCLLLDEAQILNAAAWSAILPTMSARPNPQVWLLGTPPTPHDDGEVFTRLRHAGVEGKDSRLAWIEWSAEPTDDFDDPETWAKANPAYGVRIDYEAIAAERAVMTDDQFARERLGIWDDISSAGIIPRLSWEQQADTASIAVDRL